jgi:hypothetical protein
MVDRRVLSKVLALAGAAVIATSAIAASLEDGQIRIIRGSTAPSFAIQYTGVRPARVELKVNGESLGAKNMEGVATKGVVPFKIDPAKLGDGDNVVEAFIYDKNGNIIGHEKTVITVRRGSTDPIFVKMPKMGQTVQGTVAIESGFGMEMKDAYVSFFVDNEFRSMKNFPPFNYMWDTSQETNGWHQLEAWSFDRSQVTRKSVAVRVFVNNPGGRTERIEAAPAPIKPEAAPAKPPVAKPTSAPAKPAPQPAKAAPQPATTQPVLIPVLADPLIEPLVAGLMGLRAPVIVYSEVGGYRVTTPKHPVAPKANPAKAAPVAAKTTPAKAIPVKAAPAPAKPNTAKVPVKNGTRLNATGAYAISVGGKKVDFDVQPRVESGVPLTPFRHLFEAAGGEVDWDKFAKICSAKGLGHEVVIKIGEIYATVNGKTFQLEVASFIEKGRTIVPLSFVSEALNFDISYDPATNHVLILKKS